MRDVTGPASVRLGVFKEERGRTKEGLEMVSSMVAEVGVWCEKEVGLLAEEDSWRGEESSGLGVLLRSSICYYIIKIIPC